MDNDLLPDEIKTKDYYNNNAKEWLNGLSVGSDNLLFESELVQFRNIINNGYILEIGCGVGNDARWFISHDYRYVGIDISAEMIALSKSRLTNADFREMSVYNLDFPENTFDGFWSSITLLHVPKNKLEIALKEIVRVTKNSGIGFISMKEGQGEKYEDSKQRYYAYYSQSEFENILKKQGFEVISSNIKSLGKTTFLTFFVRNNK